MDTKQKIIQSAIEIFVRHGFSASTSMITKNAGVSDGILFHYFPTKKDLIIQIYSITMREYYLHMIDWADKYVRYDDLEGYKQNLKIAWDKSIEWGIENWQKFQYIQLFESSVIADQFSISDNKEFESVYIDFVKMTERALDYQYLKDVSYAYLIKITMDLIASTTEYLHKNISNYHDPEFREKSWQIYRDMVIR